MNFFLRVLQGVAIGAGAILPGISSGVLLVVFGLYETLIDKVLHFFKNPKKNFCFLFPILLGCGIGIVLLGKLLMYFFRYYAIPTKYCFIGLILGSLPILLKQANHKNGFRLHYLFYLLVSFILTLVLLFVEQTMPYITTTNLSLAFLCMVGFCMSIGTVVPGVSSSVILMLFGVYDIYLHAISSLDISILLPMGIGLLIGSILFLNLIQFLLKKFFAPTYYAIIGFVLGSVLVLFPGFQFHPIYLISLILFGICFSISYHMQR